MLSLIHFAWFFSSRDLRGTDDREAEEAWHGGHYENFEVRWMRDSYPPYKVIQNVIKSILLTIDWLNKYTCSV